MKKDIFRKKKYRTYLTRFSVGAVAIALCGVLILWDTGIIDIPFLVRRNRRDPMETETKEEILTKEEDVMDWDAYAQASIDALRSTSLVEGAYDLVTPLPFDGQNMTITKEKLSSGEYTTAMGYVTKEDGGKSLVFRAAGMQSIPEAERYILTHYRAPSGEAVFQEKESKGYFSLNTETMTFQAIEFDPAKDAVGIDLLLPASYKKGEDANDLVWENGLFGYTGEYRDGRKTKTFTVPAQYPIAFDYSEGFAVMADENGKVTIRNDRGEEVFTHLSLILSEKEGEEGLGFHYFDGGVLRVVIALYDEEGNLKTRKESMINTKGEEVPLPEGYSAVSLNEGILVVTDGENYGYLSSTGAWIADPIYTAASPFMEGVAAVSGKDGKMGLIDWSGKTILPCAFDFVSSFSDGYGLCYAKNTGWYLLSKLNGSFGSNEITTPDPSSFHTKVTITRGPQNTFDYDPDEIIEFPPILSTPSKTTHPENEIAPRE